MLFDSGRKKRYPEVLLDNWPMICMTDSRMAPHSLHCGLVGGWLTRVQYVGHIQPPGPHGLVHLVGLLLGDSHIIGALPDNQRGADLVHMIVGADGLQERRPAGKAFGTANC